MVPPLAPVTPGLSARQGKTRGQGKAIFELAHQCRERPSQPSAVALKVAHQGQAGVAILATLIGRSSG
jgi:hypothetical protein